MFSKIIYFQCRHDRSSSALLGQKVGNLLVDNAINFLGCADVLFSRHVGSKATRTSEQWPS